jgi:hypothetical protein
MHRSDGSGAMSDPHRRLYDGTRYTGLTVREDAFWPGMWRIYTPDGKFGDMVNISRATDAAVVWLRRTSGQSSENFNWKAAVSPPQPGAAVKSPAGPDGAAHG